MSGGALAKPGERTTDIMSAVSTRIDVNRKMLSALLPAEITPDRLKALTLTSLRKNPYLLKCTPKSILACVFEAAKLGLAPDTAMADCHLIPYRDEATFQLGYRGMMKLVRRAVPNAVIKAEHVRQCDHFVWTEGLHENIEHRRAPAGDRNNSPITHAYAIARFPSGLVTFKVVDADDITRAKKTSKTRAAISPWTHHEGAMWEKTAIKRLCKTLPLDDPGAAAALSRAIDLDSAAEDGRPQDLGADLPWEGEGEGEEQAHDDDAVQEPWRCDVCGTYDDAKHEPGCPGESK